MQVTQLALISASISLLLLNFFTVLLYSMELTDYLLVDVRCRFSQMLTPIFEEAGKQIEKDFPVCILYHCLLRWYSVTDILL